ncbi:hypothetical protein AXY37_10625 [Mammaliicoccus lentus]|uniref:AAA family ATPase n=1 Tax=Mammaliicoccus lentus TaxID=42858 RepID=UPI0007D9D9FA|nr:AAA family ATPase [Mammaliicoccus lentus]MBF0748895.1 AAA family ATPase [Mammaliicoccus lentus]OAO28512.1 hypothetical protein AXY37_10625 [Mammaliicoccus lentus]TFU58495.1 hypothetical protein E4T93_05710 [Mammaliicoccus lentus]
MKIKSIHIENFRQFRDFKLKFNVNDVKKNITVIRAANSTGKTTFMQAIKWCLFGENATELEKQSELLNYDELKQSRNDEVRESYYRVVIEIVENGSTVKVNRTQRLNITKSMVKKDDCMVALEYIDDNGETKVIRNSNSEKEQIIQKKINSLLSVQMVNYFLFDGERIERLSSKGTVAKREVSDAITAVSTLPILNNSLETLNSLAKDVRKAKAKSTSNEEYTRVENIISELEDSIEDTEKKIENKMIREEEVAKELLIVEQELSEMEDVSKFQEKRTRLINENKKLKAENKTRFSAIQSLYLEYSTLKYIYLLDRKYKKINLANETDTKTIPNMEVRAIDAIIESGVCICGTKLEEENIKRLNNQRNYQPPESEEAMMKNYTISVTKEISTLDKLVEQIKEKNQEYNRVFSTIAENETELKDIDEKINNMPQQKIIDLNNKRSELVKDNNILIYEKERLIKENKNQKDELNNYKYKIEELASKLKFNEILSIQENILKKSLENLYYRKEKDEVKLRADVEENANKHFKEIISKHKKIKIDDKFNLKVYEEDGIEANISSGEAVAVSISIILSIIDTFKSNLLKSNKDKVQLLTEKDFFVVMDGPFAMLDQYFSKSISTKISNSLEQVILLTNDNQYSESIQNAFRPKTSNEYILGIPPEDRKDSILTEDLEEVIL